MSVSCIHFNFFITICILENVTEDDIIRVVEKILNTPLTIVARGNISKLPQLEEIQELVNTKTRGIFGRF